MIKTLKRIVTTLALAVVLAAPVALPAMASAQADIQAGLCGGVNLQSTPSNNCGPNDTQAQDKVNSMITTIINIFSLVVGFVSVLMIIFGGFKYITSNGDSGKVSSAKTTLVYALIGVAVAAFSELLVRLVLNRAAG